MGYTHYWDQTRKLTHTEWVNICQSARKLFDDNKDILANEYGEVGTSPVVNNKYISFNGIDDESYETCYISREPQDTFNFCKTAYKPYDAVVVKFLKMCRHFAPDAFKLSSDGGEEIFGDGMEPFDTEVLKLPHTNE